MIETHDITGVAAKEPNIYTTGMSLDLSKVTRKIDQNKLINAEKPKSPEEIFMLKMMAPATHSCYINNDYELNVNVSYKQDRECLQSDVPSISVPLTIIPMTYMESYGFQEPPGYMPVILGSFKFVPEKRDTIANIDRVYLQGNMRLGCGGIYAKH